MKNTMPRSIRLILTLSFITASATALTNTPQGSKDLDGTSWQLVKFQASDGTTLVPEDRSKYTITFGANGRTTVRVDCNRGSGTWKYKGPNQLSFGAMSMTRAKCSPDSLHDRIVREEGVIRNYVIKDGRLFLSLLEEGGTYELEPLARSRQPPRKKKQFAAD
jgi:para-nitrobenzyl esterase